MAFPDAILFEKHIPKGGDLAARIDSTATVAERLLGLDRSKGETAWIRRQPYNQVFVTGSPECSLNYPVGHPKSGQPRYNWVLSTEDPDIFLGYLKDKPVDNSPSTGPVSDVVINAVALNGRAGLGEVGNVG